MGGVLLVTISAAHCIASQVAIFELETLAHTGSLISSLSQRRPIKRGKKKPSTQPTNSRRARGRASGL